MRSAAGIALEIAVARPSGFGEDFPFCFEENCCLEGSPLNYYLPWNPLSLLAAISVVCVSLAAGLCSACFNVASQPSRGRTLALHVS